jgi:hypothetical protein
MTGNADDERRVPIIKRDDIIRGGSHWREWLETRFGTIRDEIHAQFLTVLLSDDAADRLVVRPDSVSSAIGVSLPPFDDRGRPQRLSSIDDALTPRFVVRGLHE